MVPDALLAPVEGAAADAAVLLAAGPELVGVAAEVLAGGAAEVAAADAAAVVVVPADGVLDPLLQPARAVITAATTMRGRRYL
jgi:hypothetical protein